MQTAKCNQAAQRTNQHIGTWQMQMFVFYPNEDKVGVKTIKTFAERMKSEGVFRAMMIVQANLTPFAKQCLTEMQPKYYIEVVSLQMVELEMQRSFWHESINNIDDT